MGFTDIIQSVERIAELDDRRQKTFRREYDAFEAGETDDFGETREVITAERAELSNLADLLNAERENLEKLIKETEYLTADQAVRHRDATVEKLEPHNEYLEVFRESMVRALDTMESNLDVIVEEGSSGTIEDVEPYLQDAYQAIEEHNGVVVDLDLNLMILSAYLP